MASRRGEICALRWRNVRLTGAAELAIVGSTEQTKAGIREKETKSGRARTVALTTLAIDELRLHKVRQAQELLRLGIRQSDDMYVVAQARPAAEAEQPDARVRALHSEHCIAEGPLS